VETRVPETASTALHNTLEMTLLQRWADCYRIEVAVLLKIPLRRCQQMRKKVTVAMVLAGAALAAAVNAPAAQAQGNYPSVTGLTPFTQQANYMSLPGYLRLRYLQDTGRWISRDEAVAAVRAQGLNP
jgi:hypothetical protein